MHAGARCFFMKKIAGWMLGVGLMVWNAANGQDREILNLQKESSKYLKKEDTVRDGWTRGAIINLNLSQGASHNWAAGAEKFSVSINGLLNAFLNLKKGKNLWANMLVLQYGIVNTTSQGTRKNDDRIDLLSRYGYQMANSAWYVSAMANIRTQFANGFDYSVSPPQPNSAFMAPAYILISPGLLYNPQKGFDIAFSPLTARWITVSRTHANLRPLFNIPQGKSSLNEMGAYLTANLKKQLQQNINIVSRFDLFSNYKNNPQNLDVFWTNVISLKVNKWIGVTYNFDLIYDHDVQDAAHPGSVLGTQLKSLLGVGITLKW